MRKIIPILICVLIFSTEENAHAQITVGTLGPGPYGQGSSIAVAVSIPSDNSCFSAANKLELFLSSASGDFSSETKIGESSGFFTTHINGTIPLNATAGNAYRIRVKTTAPATTTLYTGNITIVAVEGPKIDVSPAPSNQVLGTDTYGWCGSAVGNGKGIVLRQGAGSVAQTLILKNMTTGAEQSYTPGPAGFSLDNLAIGYYTATVSASMQQGADLVNSVRTYLLLNAPSKVNIQSGGTDFGCIDPETGTGADISYSVNITGENGIQNNYPGSLYRITWGDGKEDLLTHCELMARNGFLTHNYKKTSCGEPPINLGNGTSITNSFRVSVTTINPFCQSDPASATTYPKIFSKPVAHIDPATATAICLNTPVIFTNKSTTGNNSDCSLQMQWKWYVDGVLVSTDEVLQYAGFITTGIHEVKLIANNDVGLCAPSEDIRTVCVQNPPRPEFNFNGGAVIGCAPFNLKPVNTSVIDANCNADNTYSWNVTGGSVAYENGTDAHSADPEFRFDTPGIYKISLSISTASCGTVTTAEQTIVVNGPPVSLLSADAEVCNLTAYDFSPTTAGPTRTLVSGTQEQLPDTYTWTVTGGDYEFTGGTDLHSQFPKIEFKAYQTYTVTVVHKNNCGSTADSQVISFRSAPMVNAGTYEPVCNGDVINLRGEISGNVNSYSWVGGEGSFSPGRNTLQAVYTPSAAERSAGRVDLILRAVTGLPAPCNVIEGFTSITIKPLNMISSAASKSICRTTAVSYTPEAIAGSTFIWTVLSSSNASGFATSGSGTSINDVLTNINPAVAGTVVYRIRPVFDNCEGVDFQFTATIDPVPALNAAAANNQICSNTPVAISLSSSQSGLKYLWTSTTSGGTITGNTENNVTALPVTEINDILVNKGQVAGTVTYLITPQNENGCRGEAVRVTVTVRPEPVITNNNISGAQTVCEGETTAMISGTQPSGDNGPFSYQWQSSPDGNTWGNVAGATGISYDPGILQATTQFRRIVLVPNCAGSLEYPSNTVTVTVNYNAKAEFTFVTDRGCIPFVIDGTNIVATAYTDRNGTYTWYANGQEIGQGIGFPGYTIVNDNESVVIKLVVTSRSGCKPAEMSQTFVSERTTVASFSQDIKEGCGPLNVKFVNRSVAAGTASYAWDFGNGQTSAQPAPGPVSFLPDPTGKDKKYTVSLVVTSECGISTPFTSVILVRAKPKSVFSPDRTTGCSPMSVVFSNTSPVATKTTYTYDFGDGSPLVSDTNRISVPHTYSTGNLAKTYTVRMYAENNCGIDSSRYEMVVSPSTTIAELVVNGTDKRGCAPFTVPFFNNSSGADSFEYDFGDGTNATTYQSPERVEHTFTRAGIFVVKLTAKGCSNSLTTDTITVLAQPQAAFSAVRNENCDCLQVDFTNSSQGGVAYTWNFGDGSTSAEANPKHVYAQTGVYKVTLVATNINGCRETVVNNVSVTGIPGNLFIPNSFVPQDPNPELRVFGGKGHGLKSWKLSVFNKWGELLWETSRLNDGQPAEGWDGTFKGSPMPQGIYFWKAEAEFLNGTGWKGMSYGGSASKRTGIINLIR